MNKRQCIIIRSSQNNKKHICVDVTNAKQIIGYINQDDRYKKKFNHIVELILTNKRNSELYDKEDISSSCKDVTAMKFFKGQENGRLYCKEMAGPNGMFYIIMSELVDKKKQKRVNGKLKSLIEKVSTYEYEVIT